jgi:hypothetical protein
MELFIYLYSFFFIRTFPVWNLLITIKPELHPDCERGEELILSVTKGYLYLIRKLLKGVWSDRLAGAAAKTLPILIF